MSKSGNMILKPLSARLTHDTETFGKMDPYCQIKVGGQIYKTKVAKDAGKYPSWTETFSFRKNESDDLGEIEVWDYDHLSKNDQIGQGAFSLNSILDAGHKTSKWVPMTYKGKNAGEVLLEVEFYPDASKEKKDPQQAGYGFPGGYPAPMYPGAMPMYQQPPGYPPMYGQPPVYYPPPMPGYQQPPPMYQQPPAGPYQQPPGGYQQPPPGGYQQPPPGGYQQPPPGGYQQPPGGYQQPPPGPGYGYYK